MKKVAKKRYGPESDEFNRIKGRVVRIFPLGITDPLEAWVGKLRWVDRYTIGVAFRWKDDPDEISIVHKSAIRIDPTPIR